MDKTCAANEKRIRGTCWKQYRGEPLVPGDALQKSMRDNAVAYTIQADGKVMPASTSIAIKMPPRFKQEMNFILPQAKSKWPRIKSTIIDGTDKNFVCHVQTRRYYKVDLFARNEQRAIEDASIVIEMEGNEAEPETGIEIDNVSCEEQKESEEHG